MSPKQMQVIGLLGVGAIAAFVVAFALDPTPPTAGATGAAVLAHAASSASVDRVVAFLLGVSAAGLVAFVAGVRQWFETISSAPRWWGTALQGGGVVTAAMLLVGAALLFTLASEQGGITSDLARVLNDGINYTLVLAGFGVLVTVVSLTSLALATGGPLAMLGQLGVVVTLLQIPYLATAFFTSGPLVAGGVVATIGLVAAGLLILVTAVSVLYFARLMSAASRG